MTKFKPGKYRYGEPQLWTCAGCGRTCAGGSQYVVRRDGQPITTQPAEAPKVCPGCFVKVDKAGGNGHRAHDGTLLRRLV